MKAMRVHALGDPPRLDEIDAPRPAPGRTIVEMQAATVGHIDRTVWSGSFLQHPPLPYTPGVEAAGIVRSSERFAAGQRVWMRGRGLGIRSDGTWCELIAAPDEAIEKLPDAIAMTLGSAFFSPCTSAWAALPCIAPGGKAVLVGYTAGHAVSLNLPTLLQRDVALLPLNMMRREGAGRAAVSELLQRLADGRLRLDVTTFALHEAGAALDWIAQRGHRGRAVLVPSA